MALGINRGLGGGGKSPSSFPWDIYTEGTWDTKTVYPQGAWLYMTCTTLSPKIENGCRVQGQVYCSSASGDTVRVAVSYDLTSWTTIGTTATGQNTRNFSFDLSSYVNSKIYIRMECYANGQTTHTNTLNSLSIII